MKKFNDGWIVLIVFCSLIIIGGLFYLFYRLYINYIYKRKRTWYDITLPSKNTLENKIEDNLTSLIPRQSMLPLIQEFLPHELRKQPIQRQMITHLQFHEPPLFINNLKAEWDEMDTKSLDASLRMSTQTSYYTIEGQSPCGQSILDEQSLAKHSSNEFVTPLSSIEQLSLANNSQKQSSQQSFFKPFRNLSRRLVNNEKTIIDKNNSSNYIVLEMEQFKKINISFNVSQV